MISFSDSALLGALALLSGQRLINKNADRFRSDGLRLYRCLSDQ